MATFLITHGGWSAGWVWKKMHPRMRALGHELFVPTYTGVGERRHLASPDVGLYTHVADVLGMINMEDLRDFILVGHSYGGMVATQVADTVPERVAELVYLDAFAPKDGQCLFDLQTSSIRERMLAGAKESGDGWLVPSNPLPADTSPEDVAWIMPRRVSQPIKSFQQPVKLTGAVERLPRTYIYATSPPPGDLLGQFAKRARSEPGWTYLEIESSHSPHVTIPDTLAAMLDGIARRVAGRRAGKENA